MTFRFPFLPAHVGKLLIMTMPGRFSGDISSLLGPGAREQPCTAALSHLRLPCCADGGAPEKMALQGAAITAPLIQSKLPTAAEPCVRCKARLAGSITLTSQPRR